MEARKLKIVMRIMVNTWRLSMPFRLLLILIACASISLIIRLQFTKLTVTHITKSISVGGCAVNGFFPLADPEVTILMNYQTKSKLLEELWTKWLTIPSKEPYGFILERNDWHTIHQMHQTVLQILDYKKEGFFVEAGALDGVYLSNTLHLEMDHNWTGLLVEADPQSFENLIKNNRKAWSINACLALNPFPEVVRMTRIRTMEALSAISKLQSRQFRMDPKAEEFLASCFPFTSILAAQRNSLEVDYFSLDIEGAELNVLTTIPWNFVYIKVLSVEVNKLSGEELTKYLKCKGFSLVGKFKGKYIDDFLYVNQRYLRERNMTRQFMNSKKNYF